MRNLCTVHSMVPGPEHSVIVAATVIKGFPGGSVVKNLATNSRDAGDSGLIPGSGRSPGGGNGHPLQQSRYEGREGAIAIAMCVSLARGTELDRELVCR